MNDRQSGGWTMLPAVIRHMMNFKSTQCTTHRIELTGKMLF